MNKGYLESMAINGDSDERRVKTGSINKTI